MINFNLHRVERVMGVGEWIGYGITLLEGTGIVLV